MQDCYYHKNRRKYNLKVHIVLVTKYRKKLLLNGMDDFVKQACVYLSEQNNWDILAMETDKDHIHILLEYDTTERISDIIHILKQKTTYYLWIGYHSFLQKHDWKKHIFWSDGSFACSIGEVSKSILNHKANRKKETALLPPLKRSGFPSRSIL